MNDEIKEILDKLRETADYPKLNYSSYDKSYNETIDNVAMIKSFACKQLLDYITNLQQRIEYLERSNNRREDTIMGLRDEIVEYEDYKSRIEKAVEFIKTCNPNSKLDSMFLDECYLSNYGAEELLNILEGKSDE